MRTPNKGAGEGEKEKRETEEEKARGWQRSRTDPDLRSARLRNCAKRMLAGAQAAGMAGALRCSSSMHSRVGPPHSRGAPSSEATLSTTDGADGTDGTEATAVGADWARADDMAAQGDGNDRPGARPGSIRGQNSLPVHAVCSDFEGRGGRDA